MKKRIEGRLIEKEDLERLLRTGESEFLAVYGRRRVGKTFLISEFFNEEEIFFELTGHKDASVSQQLENFIVAFSKTFEIPHRLATPHKWTAALRMLEEEIERRKPRGKIVIFFDELPWLASRRSGFLQALDHFWNAWATTRRNVIVVVCGSAASWMIKKLLHHKGGLHNRVTSKIRLLPFTLAETEAYLYSRNIKLDRKQILELYMALGGVPHYLRQVEKSLSAAQNIERICFAKDGILVDEFEKLYESLFDNADAYLAVVRTLSKKRCGLTRNEVINGAKIASGGTATEMLNALEESGFISSTIPFGKQNSDNVYRLIDEFSLFHLSWMQAAPKGGAGTNYWMQQTSRPKWKSWAGFAFAGICQKHVEEIKHGLGISGVSTVTSGWYYRPSKAVEKGAQIDLLIDRSDSCISLCEMKFSETEFVITKSYADNLRHKRQSFQARTRTSKSLFTVMITTYGVKENSYFVGLVNNQLTADVLYTPT